jgi:hypothetical protein
MKNSKLFFVVLLSLFSVSALYSQTEKGKISIGGQTNLNFSTLSTKYTYQTRFNMSPQVGYFIMNRMLIGFQVPVSFSKETIHDFGLYSGSENIKTTMELTPFLSYYFSTGKLKPYISTKAGFGSEKSKISTSTTESSIFSYGGGVGLACFLNERVSLNYYIGYLSMTTREDETRGLESDIGISVYLK